jgi:hypothetical protein
VGIRCVDHATAYQLKLAPTSPAGCGRSIGIVRLQTKTTEFFIASFISEKLASFTSYIVQIIPIYFA